MSKHKGSHPRMGATNVCPFVPVSGISTEECIELSKEVSKKVGEELRIPGYLYEKSATMLELGRSQRKSSIAGPVPNCVEVLRGY